jgi:uncharacterized repeat protein (TIGR01451 family)
MWPPWPNAGAGSSYAWTINGGTITGGAGTPTITYTAGTGDKSKSMTLNVTVTNPFGCSVSSSKDVNLSPGDVAIEDWKNIPAGTESWQSATLAAADMTYPEGGTIPYRLTMPQPCVGQTWSITLQYDFHDVSTGVHFVDFLTTYNAYAGSVNGNECMGNSCSGEMTYAIPADASLSYQLPGVFTVLNGAISSVSAYSTDLSGGIIRKFITVSGTANSGGDVMLLFGAHLARDYEWGTDHGAHEWAMGTATIGFINYSAGSASSGATNVKVSDNILNNPSESDLSVVMTDSPDPVSAGQNLTYGIIVSNSGPLVSIQDTLTDAIPAGTTFVSATAPAGWTMTTPAVGGTGIVRWVLSGNFYSGGSATFGLVVAVDSSAVGTVENTATLTAGNIDAYLLNNTAHTSTTIGNVSPPPGGTAGLPDDGLNPDPVPTAEVPILPRVNGGQGLPVPGPTQPSGGSSPVAGPAPTSGGASSGAGSAPTTTEAIGRFAPNPFTSSTSMVYAVTGEAARVEIGVYDIAGRQMRALAAGIQSAGRHSVAWDGRDDSGAQVSKGMYFVRIQIGNQARQFRVTSVN